MKGFKVQIVPTAVSLANFLCGFASITYSLKASFLMASSTDPGESEHFLYLAAMLVCFAMVADLLDGKIARMTGGDSAFGAEIDSLSDVVSFGVAPAVLVVALAKTHPFWAAGRLHRAAWILAGAYAAFAAMRLARYNVEKNVQPGERFSGLPSPAAAGAIVSLALLYLGLKSQDEFLRGLSLASHAHWIIAALPIYTLLVGVLMVTRVGYSHLGRKVLSGRKPFPHLVVLALICIIAFIQLETTLAAGFTA
ncbi:MAG: CDP-alcohol phosphatidyltransferase family protein, partial [Planctomycetota bacterium]